MSAPALQPAPRSFWQDQHPGAVLAGLVAVLIAPAVVGMSALSGDANPMRFLIAGAAVAVIAVAVTISIRRGVVVETDDEVSADDHPDLPAVTSADVHEDAPETDRRG